MFIVDNYTPTRVVFGAGRLEELAALALPGKKALVCVTADGLMEKLGIQKRVLDLLEKNGIEAIVFDQVTPNPTKTGVEAATALAKNENCDFLIGLGGGSSIDTAKGVAILLKNEGDLWEYAYTGSGGKKAIKVAAPVVTISTTAGTGTETDPYCVITNEATNEKFDFAVDAIFPVVSIIDPELMVSLPRTLTLYQGFDALFHAAECCVTNQNNNRLVDVYAAESIKAVTKYLPVAAEDGSNIEARVHMSYAANICSGYTQALINATSHHIIGQTIGGLFPKVAHGASLIVIAEEYYKRVVSFFPDIFDQIGEIMGEEKVAEKPGYSFINGLVKLLDKTGMRHLPMSEFGIAKEDLAKIANHTVNVTGIADMDLYTLTTEDVEEILQKSYC